MSANNAQAIPLSDGSYGALIVDSNISLVIPTDFIFNFTSLTINTGATLSFTGITSADTIFLLATNDITINGALDGLPGNLFLGASNFILNGAIQTNSLDMMMNETISLNSSTTNTTIANSAQGGVALSSGKTTTFVDQPAHTNGVIVNTGSRITIKRPKTSKVTSLVFNPITSSLYFAIRVPESPTLLLLIIGLLSLLSFKKLKR